MQPQHIERRKEENFVRGSFYGLVVRKEKRKTEFWLPKPATI
jgi:hypothetical protein